MLKSLCVTGPRHALIIVRRLPFQTADDLEAQLKAAGIDVVKHSVLADPSNVIQKIKVGFQ